MKETRKTRKLSAYHRIVDRADYKKMRKLRDDRYKLREIGEMFGVTRERVRQILLVTK